MRTIISTVSPGLVAAYSSDTVYSKGNCTLSQNKYWRCKVNMTTGEEWTPEHWEEIPDVFAAMKTASEITGKSFDLSTEKGVTSALAILIETFGGTVTAGKNTDMTKDSPLKITKGSSTYSAAIYDDSHGIGLDITKD